MPYTRWHLPQTQVSCWHCRHTFSCAQTFGKQQPQQRPATTNSAVSWVTDSQTINGSHWLSPSCVSHLNPHHCIALLGPALLFGTTQTLALRIGWANDMWAAVKINCWSLVGKYRLSLFGRPYHFSVFYSNHTKYCKMKHVWLQASIQLGMDLGALRLCV